MADFYWRGDASGNGLWSVGSNWSTTATAVTRHTSPPQSTDRIIFQLNAYPEGATLTLDISPTIASLVTSTTAKNVNIVAVDAAVKEITIADVGSGSITLGPAVSFPDETKAIMITFKRGATLQLNGATEQYKGLYAIQAVGSYNKKVSVYFYSNATPAPLLNYTRLQAIGVSSGFGEINLANQFNTVAGLEFGPNSRLINVLDEKVFISPLKTFIDPPYVGLSILSASGMGSYPYEVNFLSSAEFSISLNGNPVSELKIAAEAVRFTGDCTINGLLSLTNASQVKLANDANVRFTTADLNDGVVLRNLTDGGLANFALGAARPTGEPDEVQYTVTGWDIKDVQSDSRNIGVENGTRAGNTEGFLFQGGPEPPIIETRAITSTINPIAFGIVKTTEELTKEVRYTVEPINFTVAAKGSKILIGNRTITSTINPIEFSVTSIPMKQQIEERLVEIMVSPIMVSVTARELKEKTGKRAVNIQTSPIKFSVETIRRKVQNESREIISYISPIRMKVTSYPLGVVKKYVAQVTVIDTKQPHFIYVAKNEPTIHVAKSEPTIKLI